MTRYALRTLAVTQQDVLDAARVISRYMPSNYEAFPVTTPNGNRAVLIVGEDVAGWNMQYVLDRLASGWYSAAEISEEKALTFTRIAAE